MEQKRILIVAAKESICADIAVAFNLHPRVCKILTMNTQENFYRFKGISFDTVIVHESFKSFSNGQHLINQLQYYMRPSTEIFYVEKEPKNA